MIKKYKKFFVALDVLLDIFLVYGSYALVTFLISRFRPGFDTSNASLSINPWGWVFSLLFVVLYILAGVYQGARIHGRRKRTAKILVCNALGVLLVASIFYLVRFVNYSRSFLVAFYLGSTALVCLKHFTIRTLVAVIRKKGRNLRHVVIIGSGALAAQYVENVRKHGEYGYNIIGNIGVNELEGVKYLGPVTEVDTILNDSGIDDVVVCPDEKNIESIDSLIAHVEKSGIPCSIIPSFSNSLSERVTVGLLGDMKIINLRTNPLDNPLNAALKRLEDIVLSLILILLSSPFMLISAIGVRLSSPGPIFFRQERVGYHRKNFKMLKFRSMRINATSDTAWSTGVDNRRTKFGSFIRKTSLDELPQFFNVLKGDMSVIGPRPEIPHFVDEFRETIPKYMVKHQVKPGITGWAQVHGFRGDTSIEGRISYDIWYIEHWSLWLDIKIVFMTIFGGMINKEKL